MNKQLKTGMSLCLCICLLAFSIFPAFAEGAASSPAEGLHIKSLKDFLAFTEDCRLDSYSKDLVVYLDTDIDLSNTNFSGIPVFCGTFYGNGYTISGLSITNNGSIQGLFRYLKENAVVENLNVEGKVTPGGSRNTVGGIAGSNAGTIENCSFEGQVNGNEQIGGIAGINLISGVIKGCRVDGTMYGTHFVGGVTGENAGLVRECVNFSKINVTATQNSVDFSDITIDSVLGIESVNTVTDIGGIAGISNGVIRSCENRGNIGYKHIGYNIGGIVGRQQGFVVDCKNYAQINGRKEVGGIVGQMEPVSKIEYTADTLQILREQMDTLMVLVRQAEQHSQNNEDNIHKQIVALKDQIEIAINALKQLIPDKENPQLPDKDTIISSANALSSSLSNIQKLTISITSSIEEANHTMNNDIRAITKQLTIINQTLNNATDGIGGSITDSSDEDTEEDYTGKVSLCVNYGNVMGDLNVGGITGAVSWENLLNPEEDLQITGENSLNFQYEVRAVISGCENMATVSAKKRNAGGVIGLLSLGLVKNCVNTGTLDTESADYIGGIAGNSTGYIRGSSAKCELRGSVFVGGIAGSAILATDCRSMVYIQGGKEKLGSILGILDTESASPEDPLKNNYYLLNDRDYGGVDGVSYAGFAQSLSQEQFFALPEIKDIFSRSKITFIFEDGSIETVTVGIGGTLDEADIPEIPFKDGYSGKWDGLEDADLTDIDFDMTFQVSYKAYQMTVQSDNLRDNGKPVLLAEGHFSDMNHFEIEELPNLPAFSGTQKALEGWVIPNFSDNTKTQLRFAYPEGCKPKSIQIFVRDCDGDWNPVKSEINGSYIVFSVHPTEDAFCVVEETTDYYWVIYAAGGTALAIVVIVTVVIVKKKAKKKVKSETTDSSETKKSTDEA